jgi:hypothetical protein
MESFPNRSLKRASLVAAVTVTGACALAVAAAAVGSQRWKRGTVEALERLEAGATNECAGYRFERDRAFAALPGPVRRYFTFALAPGQPAIRRAFLHQDGELRTGARDRWRSFRAIETFSTDPAGFVWDATVPGLPLLPLRIRDCYSGGRGASEASLAGVVPLGGRHGSVETDSASLLRYLAELPWVPTALLPESGVRWSAIDRDHARATLTHRGITVSIDVEFGARSEIVHIAAMRHRDVDGKPVLTPWSGRYGTYTRMDGMMIPTSAEVEWCPPDGAVAVWRANVACAEYEFHS